MPMANREVSIRAGFDWINSIRSTTTNVQQSNQIMIFKKILNEFYSRFYQKKEKSKQCNEFGNF